MGNVTFEVEQRAHNAGFPFDYHITFVKFGMLSRQIPDMLNF